MIADTSIPKCGLVPNDKNKSPRAYNPDEIYEKMRLNKGVSFR